MNGPFRSKSGNPVDLEYILGQPGVSLKHGNLTLECSSVGDIFFSAFGAHVDVYGAEHSIEYHYQTSKLFKKLDSDGDVMYDPINEEPLLEQARTIKEAKGRKPEKIIIGDLVLDKEFLSQWYKLLWVKYLDSNQDFVTYLHNFDDFTDKFKGSSVNCQADVIRQYIKEGRESVMKDCRVLYNILAQQKRVNKQYEQEREFIDDWIDSHT